MYKEYAQIFKALSDPTRAEIYHMLKNGEMCGCVILEKFNITQPTLSYHMKLLVESGLVKFRKEGVWNHYSLDGEGTACLKKFL